MSCQMLERPVGAWDDIWMATLPSPSGLPSESEIVTFCVAKELGLMAAACASGWIYIWRDLHKRVWGYEGVCAAEHESYLPVTPHGSEMERRKAENNVPPFPPPFVVCSGDWRTTSVIRSLFFVKWPFGTFLGCSLTDTHEQKTSVLVSYHQDSGLLRIWSLAEGRCFLSFPTAAWLGSAAEYVAPLCNSRFIVAASRASLIVVDLWLRVPCVALALQPSPQSNAGGASSRAGCLRSVPFLTLLGGMASYAASALEYGAGSAQNTFWVYGLPPTETIRILKTNRPCGGRNSTEKKDMGIPFYFANEGRSIISVELSSGTVICWDVTLHLRRWMQNFSAIDIPPLCQIPRLRSSAPEHRQPKGTLTRWPTVFPQTSLQESEVPGQAKQENTTTRPYDTFLLPEDLIPAGHILVAEPEACVPLVNGAETLGRHAVQHERWSSDGCSSTSTLVVDDSLLGRITPRTLLVYDGHRPEALHLQNGAHNKRGMLGEQSFECPDLFHQSLLEESRLSSSHGRRWQPLATPTFHTFLRVCAFHVGDTVNCEEPKVSSIQFPDLAPLVELKDPGNRDRPNPSSLLSRRFVGLQVVRRVSVAMWDSLCAGKSWTARLRDNAAVTSRAATLQASSLQGSGNAPSPLLKRAAHEAVARENRLCTLIACFLSDGKVYLYNPQTLSAQATVDPSDALPLVCLTQLPPDLVPDSLEKPHGLIPQLFFFSSSHQSSETAREKRCFRCMLVGISQGLNDRIHCIQLSHEGEPQESNNNIFVATGWQRFSESTTRNCLLWRLTSWREGCRLQRVWNREEKIGASESETSSRIITSVVAEREGDYCIATSYRNGELLLRPITASKESEEGTTKCLARWHSGDVSPLSTSGSTLSVVSTSVTSPATALPPSVAPSEATQCSNKIEREACTRNDSIRERNTVPGCAQALRRELRNFARRRLPISLKDVKPQPLLESFCVTSHPKTRGRVLITTLMELNNGLLLGGSGCGDVLSWSLHSLKLEAHWKGLLLTSVTRLLPVLHYAYATYTARSSERPDTLIIAVDTSGLLVVLHIAFPCITRAPPHPCGPGVLCPSQHGSGRTGIKRHAFLSIPRAGRLGGSDAVSSMTSPVVSPDISPRRNVTRLRVKNHQGAVECQGGWSVCWDTHLPHLMASPVATNASPPKIALLNSIHLPRLHGFNVDALQRATLDVTSNTLILQYRMSTLLLYNMASGTFLAQFQIGLALSSLVSMSLRPPVSTARPSATDATPHWFAPATLLEPIGLSKVTSAINGGAATSIAGGLRHIEPPGLLDLFPESALAVALADQRRLLSATQAEVEAGGVWAETEEQPNAGVVVPLGDTVNVSYSVERPFLSEQAFWARFPELVDAQFGNVPLLITSMVVGPGVRWPLLLLSIVRLLRYTFSPESPVPAGESKLKQDICLRIPKEPEKNVFGIPGEGAGALPCFTKLLALFLARPLVERFLASTDPDTARSVLGALFLHFLRVAPVPFVLGFMGAGFALAIPCADTPFEAHESRDGLVDILTLTGVREGQPYGRSKLPVSQNRPALELSPAWPLSPNNNRARSGGKEDVSLRLYLERQTSYNENMGKRSATLCRKRRPSGGHALGGRRSHSAPSLESEIYCFESVWNRTRTHGRDVSDHYHSLQNKRLGFTEVCVTASHPLIVFTNAMHRLRRFRQDKEVSPIKGSWVTGSLPMVPHIPVFSSSVLVLQCLAINLITVHVLRQLTSHGTETEKDPQEGLSTAAAAAFYNVGFSAANGAVRPALQRALLRDIRWSYYLVGSLGLWTVLALHPACSRIRETAKFWIPVICSAAPTTRQSAGLIHSIATLLAAGQPRPERARFDWKESLVEKRRYLLAHRITGTLTEMFYSGNGSGEDPKKCDNRSRSILLLLLTERVLQRPDALKGIPRAFMPVEKSIVFLIPQLIFSLIGNGGIAPTPAGLIEKSKPLSPATAFTLLELFGSGYSLLWRSALLSLPSDNAEALKAEWSVWTTDIASLSAAADIALEKHALAKYGTISQESLSPKRDEITTAGGAQGVSSQQRVTESPLRSVPKSNETMLQEWIKRDTASHITLLHHLIFRIFTLAQHPVFSAPATAALLEIGKRDSLRLIRALGYAARRLDFNPNFTNTAIMTLARFFLKHPAVALRYLLQIVEAIVKCLDPSNPYLRRSALASATSALFQLVRVYPMITFYQAGQHFAVGTYEGFIIIYDLRTATKWRVLSGHTGPISVLAFTDDGSHIASYSAHDRAFCLWQCSSAAFLGGILGGSGKCRKLLRLPKITSPRHILPVEEQLKCLRLTYKSLSVWTLRREDGCSYTVRV